MLVHRKWRKMYNCNRWYSVTYYAHTHLTHTRPLKNNHRRRNLVISYIKQMSLCFRDIIPGPLPALFLFLNYLSFFLVRNFIHQVCLCAWLQQDYSIRSHVRVQGTALWLCCGQLVEGTIEEVTTRRFLCHQVDANWVEGSLAAYDNFLLNAIEL